MPSLRFLTNDLADALYELMCMASEGQPKNKARVTKQKVRVSQAIWEIARNIKAETPTV